MPVKRALLWFGILAACGGKGAESPRHDQEMVPANSAFEAEPAKRPADREAPAPESEPSTAPTATVTVKGEPPKAAGLPPKSGPKATKQECGKALDKYLELAIGNDARLQGLPPDVIAEAKRQVRSQQSDPCTGDVTRSQYTCAMAAKTTAQWEACMK